MQNMHTFIKYDIIYFIFQTMPHKIMYQEN